MTTTSLNRTKNPAQRSNGSPATNHVAPSRFDEFVAKIAALKVKERACADGSMDGSMEDAIGDEICRLEEEMSREAISAPSDALILLKAMRDYFSDGEADRIVENIYASLIHWLEQAQCGKTFP